MNPGEATIDLVALAGNLALIFILFVALVAGLIFYVRLFMAAGSRSKDFVTTVNKVYEQQRKLPIVVAAVAILAPSGALASMAPETVLAEVPETSMAPETVLAEVPETVLAEACASSHPQTATHKRNSFAPFGNG